MEEKVHDLSISQMLQMSHCFPQVVSYIIKNTLHLIYIVII